MEFRPTPSAPPVEITLDHFCDLVRAGKVRPDALYREPWTLGQWLTVDNLRLFHKHSPVQHPPGPKLIEARESERRGAEMFQRYTDYRTGTLVEDRYQVRPLADAAREPGVVGVSRLMIFPAFEPERIVTALFHADGVAVEAVAGSSQLWRSLQTFTRKTPDGTWEQIPGGEPFDPRRAVRGQGRVKSRRAPAPFTSWGAFVRAASPLPDCSTETLDGVVYRHKMLFDGRLLDVEWANPDEVQHAPQLALVRGYMELVRAAGLRRVVKWKP